PHPRGMRDNSPMLQHWENRVNLVSPEGTASCGLVFCIPPTMYDMKRARNRRVHFPSRLETSFIFDRLEALLDQGPDNAIQVRLRVGVEGCRFVVVSIH